MLIIFRDIKHSSSILTPFVHLLLHLLLLLLLLLSEVLCKTTNTLHKSNLTLPLLDPLLKSHRLLRLLRLEHLHCLLLVRFDLIDLLIFSDYSLLFLLFLLRFLFLLLCFELLLLQNLSFFLLLFLLLKFFLPLLLLELEDLLLSEVGRDELRFRSGICSWVTLGFAEGCRLRRQVGCTHIHVHVHVRKLHGWLRDFFLCTLRFLIVKVVQEKVFFIKRHASLCGWLLVSLSCTATKIHIVILHAPLSVFFELQHLAPPHALTHFTFSLFMMVRVRVGMVVIFIIVIFFIIFFLTCVFIITRNK